MYVWFLTVYLTDKHILMFSMLLGFEDDIFVLHFQVRHALKLWGVSMETREWKWTLEECGRVARGCHGDGAPGAGERSRLPSHPSCGILLLLSIHHPCVCFTVALLKHFNICYNLNWENNKVIPVFHWCFSWPSFKKRMYLFVFWACQKNYNNYVHDNCKRDFA